MKTQSILSATRLLLGALAALGLASCVSYDEGYYVSGGYASGGYSSGGYYPGSGYASGGGYYYGDRYYEDEWYDDYYDYHPPVYRSYVSYSAAWPYYYGGRYYSYRWWNDDRYRDYCHDHGSNHNRYRKRRSSEEMKLVRYHGPDRGRLPTGYHSEQWYKDRGYSLKTNTYRERDGDLRGRQPSSSSRSRDDRPSSDHPRARYQPEKYRYTGDSKRDDDRRRESSRSRDSNRSKDSDRSRGSGSGNRGSSSGDRSHRDDRPSSEHPRATRQPDKYHYTGSGGGNRSDRSDRSSRGGDRGGDRGGRSEGKGKKD